MKQKNFMARYLQEITPVSFELETAEEFQIIGNGPAQFRVKLRREIPRRELLQSTSLALGEAYARGDLEVDGDLYQVLDLFLGSMERFRTSRWALAGLLHTSLNEKKQKEQVASHYDLGNDFYHLWLDETMSYSCGYFKHETDTLYEAQCNKVERILEKLCLKKDMTLLDIGCGWGYLLIRAAKEYGVKGLGITLSHEQQKEFEERIEKEGLTGQIEVARMDYRELEKSGRQFDRVVSVGMLEHVGRTNYELFVRNVNSVLKPGGLLLLHYISALKEYPGDPWIRKYIFPGGMVPSLREMIHLFGEYRFYTLDVESLRRHYYKTLRCWERNFSGHRQEVEANMGTEFARMWELYLSSCAATFHNGIIDLHQILASKGVNNDLPMTRWY